MLRNKYLTVALLAIFVGAMLAAGLSWSHVIRASVGGVVTISARLAGLTDPINNQDAVTKAYMATAGGAPAGWTCTNRSNACSGVYACSVNCVGSEKLITGGCSGDTSSQYSYGSYPSGQGWYCVYNVYQGGTVTASANCCL